MPRVAPPAASDRFTSLPAAEAQARLVLAAVVTPAVIMEREQNLAALFAFPW